MRLRQELRDRLSIEAELRAGWPTQFVVTVDGATFFTRRTAKRLPLPGEIAEMLASKNP